MKKIYSLVAIIAFLVLNSCSKTSSSTSSSGQKLMKTFQLYNKINNQLIEEFLFQYTNGKITGITQSDPVLGQTYMDINYINQYLTEVTVYKNANKIPSEKYGVYIIKYNSAGNVIYDSSAKYTVLQNDTLVYVRKYEYYNDSVKVNHSNRGTDVFIVKNENLLTNLSSYDNNISPLYRLKTVFGYFYYPYYNSYFMSYFITKNNLVSFNSGISANCIYDNQGNLLSCDEIQDRRFNITYY